MADSRETEKITFTFSCLLIKGLGPLGIVSQYTELIDETEAQKLRRGLSFVKCFHLGYGDTSKTIILLIPPGCHSANQKIIFHVSRG